MSKVGTKRLGRKHRRSTPRGKARSGALRAALTRRIHAQSPRLSEIAIENMVKAILNDITASMAKGDLVQLRGIGDFRIKQRPAAPARNKTVSKKRVYGPSGRSTVFTVDTGSTTLGSDLRYAFEKSVAKARRENKKKVGSSDARIQ